jgi:hypothetical protein
VVEGASVRAGQALVVARRLSIADC